jgi:anaerobic selenocysteine-containing dehydrogenase
VRLTTNLVDGRTRIAVADPRFSKLAGKAWKWLPLMPGTDSALALAIMRWMFDHDRIDKRFLANANKAAARTAHEDSWCNATWLVEIRDGKPGKLARAADHGLAEPAQRLLPGKDGQPGRPDTERFLLAMVDGKPAAIEPNSEDTPVVGDLFVQGRLADGTEIKSALQILRDEADRHTVEEWCALAGVPSDSLVAVARDLTSHGKRSAVGIHRGPAQHTNGFHNVLAWMTVNMLLGNFDARAA